MKTNFREIWGSPIKPARCPNCEVAHLIPDDMENALCPACYESHLEDQPEILRPEPPELILNFIVAPDNVTNLLKDWMRGVWLRPAELDPAILTARLTRTFTPMWLVDSRVSGTWGAQMGFDYQVASSQEFYRNGRWITQEVTETRIHWEPRAGQIDRVYQNLGVPALEEHHLLVSAVGNYNWKNAQKFTPTPMANASVRVPSLLPDAAWSLAKSGFDRFAAADCQVAADAQHIEQFTIEADYLDLNWTQLLLPLYTTSYRDDDGEVYPILINGQSGRIFGSKRASQKKAWRWTGGLVAAALAFILFTLLSWALAGLLPLLSVLGGVFLVIGLIFAVHAPIPILWAWSHNRRNKDRD
ncbi:MAG: hypothetical protein PVG32_19125 [Anaerolineales bacterium]